jgi:hypothetical protein
MAKKSRSKTTPTNVPKVSVAPASPDGPNRKVRKEDARRQREALQRKATRRKLYRWGVVGLAVVVVLVAGTMVVLNNNGKSSANPGPTPSPSVLVGMQKGPAPWSQGLVGLKERLVAIGVPFGPQETLVYHIHDLVQIYIDGKPTTIPPGIGINSVGTQAEQFISAIHTHDASGIVHIESPTKREYTLGQFFTIWGVQLTPTCLGTEYCNSGNKQLRVFYDGVPYTKDPAGILFSQHHDIVVTFGTKAQLPDPIPSRYSGSLSPSCAGPPASC